MKYKRIFTIVIDSLGVGGLPDSYLYDDINVDTLGNIDKYSQSFDIPHLQRLGLANLHPLKNVSFNFQPNSYYTKAKEVSKGKDTITGHLELMGVISEEPFITFTDTGFPEELIKELEKRCNHGIIGNKAASGTEIINELGDEHIATNNMIVYTSADSVLQIAAHEEHFGLDELYRCCEIARELTLDKKWRIGRVIARPFLGTSGNYVRTSNRHDYALDPKEPTVLDLLKRANFNVIGIGKINDIFNGCGITKSLRSVSSIEGMQQTIDIASNDFTGLCFTNLVDFDALWGHRRDINGYRQELESFDKLLGQLMETMNKDDLLILCADHGNDPSYKGSDHTREYIPIIFYNNQMQGSGLLPIAESFSVIGKTILENFKIDNNYFGTSYLPFLK